MLLNARRAVSGSVSSVCRATAAWMVAVVRVCPTESCSSWASRLRWDSRCIWSWSAASRSAGPGPSRAGASARNPAAAAAQA